MTFQNGLVATELTGITYLGRPRQYRSDCQAGQFKLGASKMLGKTLEMEVFSYRTFDDELFGYPHQTWLQLLFIDTQNVVSSILFKTESMDNFGNLLIDLSEMGEAIGAGKVKAVMEKRTSANNGTSYYAVEFSWQKHDDEGLRLLEIAEFVNLLPIEKLAALEPDKNGDKSKA